MKFKDPYVKDLGYAPDLATLVECVRRLSETTQQMQRRIARLTAVIILLAVILIAFAVADHLPAVRVALAAADQWRQQWWH